MFYAKVLTLSLVFFGSLSVTGAQEPFEEISQELTIVHSSITTKLDYSPKTLPPGLRKALYDADMEEILFYQETLEILNLNSTYFGSPSVFTLVSDVYFPNLKELHLDFHYNSVLDFVALQTNIETLSLAHWIFGEKGNPFPDSIKLKDLRQLSSLIYLKDLNLQNSSFLPENSEQLQYMLLPNLEKLDASGSNIKGVHWDTFAPNLRILKLNGSEINGTDLNHIAKLWNLEELQVNDTKIQGGALTKLGQLPCLTKLALVNNDMTKADFSKLQSLEVLDLSEADFSIASFTSLENLQNLKKLRLNRIFGRYYNKQGYYVGAKSLNITPLMIQQLQEKLPYCEIEL